MNANDSMLAALLTSPLTAAQAADALGLSTSGARVQLEGLRRAGQATRERIGRSYLYTAASACPASLEAPPAEPTLLEKRIAKAQAFVDEVDALRAAHREIGSVWWGGRSVTLWTKGEQVRVYLRSERREADRDRPMDHDHDHIEVSEYWVWVDDSLRWRGKGSQVVFRALEHGRLALRLHRQGQEERDAKARKQAEYEASAERLAEHMRAVGLDDEASTFLDSAERTSGGLDWPTKALLAAIDALKARDAELKERLTAVGREDLAAVIDGTDNAAVRAALVELEAAEERAALVAELKAEGLTFEAGLVEAGGDLEIGRRQLACLEEVRAAQDAKREAAEELSRLEREAREGDLIWRLNNAGLYETRRALQMRLIGEPEALRRLTAQETLIDTEGQERALRELEEADALETRRQEKAAADAALAVELREAGMGAEAEQVLTGALLPGQLFEITETLRLRRQEIEREASLSTSSDSASRLEAVSANPRAKLPMDRWSRPDSPYRREAAVAYLGTVVCARWNGGGWVAKHTEAGSYRESGTETVYRPHELDVCVATEATRAAACGLAHALHASHRRAVELAETAHAERVSREAAMREAAAAADERERALVADAAYVIEGALSQPFVARYRGRCALTGAEIYPGRRVRSAQLRGQEKRQLLTMEAIAAFDFRLSTFDNGATSWSHYAPKDTADIDAIADALDASRGSRPRRLFVITNKGQVRTYYATTGGYRGPNCSNYTTRKQLARAAFSSAAVAWRLERA